MFRKLYPASYQKLLKSKSLEETEVKGESCKKLDVTEAAKDNNSTSKFFAIFLKNEILIRKDENTASAYSEARYPELDYEKLEELLMEQIRKSM